MTTDGQFRVGVIGLGLMGRRMLRALAGHPRFESVIAFDPAPDAAALEGAHGAPLALAASAEAVIGNPLVELVYIASPPTHHAAQATAALDAGRPVFCEKPLTVDPVGAADLAARAVESGLAHAVNFPFATLDGLEEIERSIRTGDAGDPVRIEIALHFSAWPRTWHTAGPWLAGPTEGGFLREVFSHFAYLTRRIAGPLTVHARDVVRSGADATESIVTARLDAGGVPVLLSGGVGGAAPDHCAFSWYGTRRSYRLRDWSRLDRAGEGEVWTEWTPSTSAPPGHRQLDALAARLEGRPSPLPGFDVAAEIVTAVESLVAGI